MIFGRGATEEPPTAEHIKHKTRRTVGGSSATEEPPTAEHIKHVDGHLPEKPSMAAGDCVPDTMTKAIFGGLSM